MSALTLGYFMQILQGTLITLQLAVCALIIGLILGLLFASIESIPIKILRHLSQYVVTMLRALPELLVLFFIYFGLSQILTNLFHHYIDVNAFVAGSVALGLIFAAYASEVFRGAFHAIEQGQIDAAIALGLSPLHRFFRIRLPQSLRHALPGLSNLWLVLLKDTAIVMLIGLPDLMSNAKISSSSTRAPFLYFLIAALIYLCITSISQIVLNYFTKKTNRYLYQHESHELFS